MNSAERAVIAHAIRILAGLLSEEGHHIESNIDFDGKKYKLTFKADDPIAELGENI